MAAVQDYSPVSPLEAPPMDFPPVQRSHVADQWRPSIESIARQETPIASSQQPWAPIPLPPIPPERETEAWRKRSIKRCSYASQMSNYSAADSPADMESKHQRAVSVVSLDPSIRSTPSRNFSRPTRWREDRARSVDVNWKLASFNPHNWSPVKKWFHTIAAGMVAFTCTFASSVIPPTVTVLDGQLEPLSIISILPTALFAAGLAFGPVLNPLVSEIVGRKVVSIISMATFALVTLGSAFVTSFYPFVACRVAAAILASPTLDASLMTTFSLWPAEIRHIPLATYSLMLLLGLTLAPVLGPYILYYENRSWTQYVTLFAFTPSIVLLVSMRETHRNTLRRTASSGETCGRFTTKQAKALGRPLYLLCIRPRILMCTIFSSCNFATFFAIFIAFPGIFAEAYKASLKSRGLSLIGLMIGVAVGFIILTAIQFLEQCFKTAGSKGKGHVQSEKDNSLNHHAHMDSRASITPFRHAPSAMADFGQSRNASRSSLPYLKAGTDTQVRDIDKNMDVAVAVANYINDLPSNKGNEIDGERILLVLEQSLKFDELCLLLEGYDLTFDRAALASVLADALSNGLRDSRTTPLSFSPAASPLTTPTLDDKVWPLPPDSPQLLATPQVSRTSGKDARHRQREHASAQGHLWIGLLGSLLSTGALFMFGWTVDLRLPWIVPVVATGIFATGGTLVFVSATEYLMANRRSADAEHAEMASSIFRWLFAAAFSIFAVPLFNAMDAAWAASVLAFINAGGSMLALTLLILDRISGSSSRRQTAA